MFSRADTYGSFEPPMENRKRGRGQGAAMLGGKSYAQRRAMAIAARVRQQFPYAKYGTAHFLRGSQGSLDTFGPSFKEANLAQRAARKAMGFTGRGLYTGYALRKGYNYMKGNGGYIGKTLGTLGGSIAGVAASALPVFASGGTLAPAAGLLVPSLAAAGGAAGDQLEDYLKAKFSRTTGRGSYVTNDLVSMAGAKAVVPEFQRTDIHEFVYSNKEYLCDIYAPPTNVPFSIQTFAINPALQQTFPWLSQLALNFEEYEMIQLIFTYKSTVADFASASGQVGQIVMATQYNPSAEDFADKDEMMLYEGGMSCKTTESMIHGVECDPAKLQQGATKYTRGGSLPPTEDLKSYDIGKLSLAILNCPSTYANQQLGELWVSYTIKLRKPKVASNNAYNVQRAVFTNAAVGATTAQCFGMSTDDNLISDPRATFGVTVIRPPTTSWNIPNGVGTDDLQQDIPTTWSPSVSAAACFVLPPSFGGIIRLRAVVQKDSNWGSGNGIFFVAQGNIFRFKDIPSTSGVSLARVWKHRINTFDDFLNPTTPTSWTQADNEVHLRVLPSTSGQGNLIWMNLNTGGGGNVVPYVEFTAYNTYLSVNDNGTNDRLLLQRDTSKSAYSYA